MKIVYNPQKVAVVITFNFDSQVSAILFENEEEAVKFIAKDLEEEYFIDCHENNWTDITEKWISEDGRNAKLINHFPDRDDITEWCIGDVYISEGD